MQQTGLPTSFSHAVIDWIDADDQPFQTGAESDYYLKLEQPNLLISIKTYREDVVALCAQLTQLEPEQTIKITIVPVPYTEILRANLKIALGKKKVKKRIGMEEVNEMLLEQLVTVNRNCPYNYHYDRSVGIIELAIFLKSYL